MAKKKQRINLIDRNGNSQVVQVNSSDLSDSTKNAKKSTIKKAISGGASEARNYAPLVKAANTVTGGTAGLFLNKDKQGHSLVDNTIQLGKNLASGTFSGLTSIPDSELYEVRNSLEKGEKKAEETTGVRDTLKSLFGTGKDALLSSNPITAQFVKNDDDSKGVEGALKGLKNVSDIGGGKKGLYKSIEAFGEAYSDYKKAKGQEGNLSKKVEKLQEKIDKPSEEYAQKVQEENQNYSKPVQVLGENFQTVGNMVPSIAMSAVTKNPSAGMWALYQGAKGSSTKEALQKGADLDTATAIGNAKGLLEVGTEQLSGGIKFKGKSVYGQGALDDVIENNVNRLVKNKAANWLVKQFGTAPLGEIAEETISDLAGHFIDKNTVDPNAKYTAKDWLHTAGMTYLSTLTLNLLGGSFGKSSYNQNLQSMAETQVADIQNRVDRGLMSQEDGARTIEQITQELNDSIGTNEEISTPEEIQEALANTSSEDIQQAVASATNAITNQIEQGKLNEQQGQQLLETIQENAQDMLEQQQKLTQNQNGQMQFNLDNQSTIEDKIFLVQSLNDTERAALTEITQKLKRGEQLNEQDRATLQYLNSKGTPQAAENTPIQNEVAQPSAIPQETQNVAQNIENVANNDIVNKDRIEYNNNTSTKEGVSNDFRTIQEESRRKLNEEGWGDSIKTVDEDLRGRIRGALSEELERRGYSNSDNDGLLKLESKGNKFNIHKNVDGETFHDMFEIARANTNYGELVDLHPVETNEDSTGYNEMNNYLSDDGMQGFSITKDGDVVSVFNADPTRKGFLRSIVSEINSNGKTLDCYNSSKQALNEIYSKIFGWKTASVMDHNMDYDHDNIAKNHDNPPVSFMVNPNQLKSDVTDADLNKKFGKDQYDEAFAYRSALMKDGNGNKNDFIFGEDGYFKGMKEGTSDSSFSNENALANRDNNAIDKQGNPVMAPFLQNNGGNGGNGGGNNNTTALGKQPEPKKGSVEADILRSYDERIANKKKPFKEKIDTVMHETTRALFDKGEEIYRIGKGHNDAELYPLYDLAQTSKASADFSINADQTNLKGEKVGESLNKVWEEVEKKNLVYEMNKYLYEQHNLDRWNQLNEDGSRKYVFGPEHSDIVSKKNIADLLRLHPELEELSKPILQYQKNLKQLLVDSGLQSQSQSDKLDSIYKNYVPTWRDKDNTGIKAMSNYGGNVTVNNQIKAAKGSSENLLPLKEVQAQMTENIFKAARMNVFLQQLYKDIGDINELKKIGMNSLKSDTNIEPIDADAFYKAAEEHLDEYLKNYAPNNAKVDKVNGQPVATVWFNGHKVTMPIDKGIQTALEPVTVDGSVAKILETINNFKRGVITEYNPIFAITNAKKDVDDAIINSKFSAIEYQAEYEKSIKEMLSNKKMSKEEQTLFNQYLAMGGYSNTVFDKRTGFAKEPKAGGKVLAKIGDMNDFIEQIPRFTEFKLTLKHGGSLTEAMYNAAEVTTNFKRYGVLTKKMDKLATTFFSASMAGFYKQVRNLTQQPSGRAYARFAAKSLAIGLTPAIINGLMYANPFGDDDDKDEAAEAYKNLPQYVKDDYLVWYIGDGKFMRIPKGRAASIPGIVYNAAKSKVQKEEVSFGEMVNSVLNQVGPSNPLSSNAILQIWQSGLFDNKSQGTSWNGSKIESSYLHKKEVTERYDSKTDEISKAISKGVSKATGGKIKISPKKLNYTIDQNSGIIGDILLPIFTPKSTGPSTAARIFNPITSKFTTDTVVSNKTSNKFYDKIDKYNEKVDAETATRADLVKKSYLSSVSGEIADKRKQIEEIESSDLSKNEKYKQTRELQKEINNLQKKALEDENTYKKVGKEVSTIGDEVYYKSSYDGRTTWKKESDKTKAKRDELGLSVEKYYYYKKDEAFKKPDGKTTSIVDGKTAKDKIALVDAFGFDPSDYEKYSYEINQIKAGKDTQRQVTEYIESLPISATQKAALYKKKYKSYRNADRTIYNSIENSNLSKEEKESLAKFLKIK